MSNIKLSKYPFISPDVVIASVSSEQTPLFLADNVLDIPHPTIGWRTNGITNTGTIDIHLGSSKSIDGIIITNANFPELKVFESADNVDYDEITPNMVLKSHEPSDGAWSKSSASATADGTEGPTPAGPNAEKVTFSGGAGTVSQTISGGWSAMTGKLITISCWLKPTTLSSVKLMYEGASSQEKVITLTGGWQRAVFSFTVGSDANTSFTVRLGANGATGDVYWGGMQVSINTLSHNITTYETGSNGLVVPVVDETGRRHVYLDLLGYSNEYVRIQIPANQTVDSGSHYGIGTISVIESLTTVHGKHNFPRGDSVINPNSQIEKEGASPEKLSLGDPRMVVGFASPLVNSRSGAFLKQLRRQPAGTPIAVVLNIRYPDAPNDSLVNPALAFISEIQSPDGAYQYEMPEIINVDFLFEEII